MTRYSEYEAIVRQMSEVQGAIQHMIAAKSIPWFFDVATNLFMVLDTQGRIIQINQAWLDLLGIGHAKELDRIPFLDIVHPQDQDRTRLSWVNRKEEVIGHIYNRYRRSDGTYVWVVWPEGSGQEDPNTGYMHCIAEPVLDSNLIYGLELNFGRTEQLYIP